LEISTGDRDPSYVLDPDFLLGAYATGYFPMADSSTGEICWYSPDPRAIFELDGLRISRSLRHSIRANRFTVQWDSAFEQVIRACSARPETWISEDIIDAYRRLFEQGFAHSVEAWTEGALAGGLYGIALGKAFFGESMFSLQKDASKVALVALVQRLKDTGFLLLDVQFQTPHLKSLGAVEISRTEYLRRLRAAIPLVDKTSGMSHVTGA